MLEATMLVVDNSEWARNGDYSPNRLDAQNDAVTLLFNAKTQSNPENMVGLMTMAGKGWARNFIARLKGPGDTSRFAWACRRPEVLVTLSSDIGKILTALHQIKIGGSAAMSTAVQIAQVGTKLRSRRLPEISRRSCHVRAARIETPTKQEPKAKDYSLRRESDRRGRKGAGQAGQEAQKEQRCRGRCQLWRRS